MAKTKATTATFEDFIKKYTNSGTLSYSDWLTQTKGNEARQYAEEMKDASDTYARSLSGYGQRAEALAKNGLQRSGYSDFIDANAYSEMQRSKESALQRMNESAKENRLRYSDYVRGEQSKKYKNITDAINKIAGYDKIGEDEAYSYALSAGLPAELARKVGELGKSLSRPQSSAVSSILSRVIGKGYKRDSLYYYFKSLGFSQDESNELADVAYNLSKQMSNTNKNWTQILNEKKEK